jgi:pyrimidine operon attenuation protein/uracil phosphoribosyltransferase
MTTVEARVCLYDADAIRARLEVMARAAAGLINAPDEVTLVGIRRRGVPLARMLADVLTRTHGFPRLPLMELAIARYADDLRLLHPETLLTEDPDHARLDLSGRTALVIDDVLYYGYSMLRAVEYLAHKHAAEIRTVVLVDRGVARLPVRADVTGIRLEVAPGDIIECNVPPYENALAVNLLRPAGART